GHGMTSRVALVTGGAGGMGRAIRVRLESAGDIVVAADLHDADVVANVTRVGDCERMVAEAVAVHGKLDILICAAGVWVEGPSAEMSEDQWDRTIDVNLKGTFFACRYAIPELVKTAGSIVLISSDYGLVGGPGAAI